MGMSIALEPVSFLKVIDEFRLLVPIVVEKLNHRGLVQSIKVVHVYVPVLHPPYWVYICIDSYRMEYQVFGVS